MGLVPLCRLTRRAESMSTIASQSAPPLNARFDPKPLQDRMPAYNLAHWAALSRGVPGYIRRDVGLVIRNPAGAACATDSKRPIGGRRMRVDLRLIIAYTIRTIGSTVVPTDLGVAWR